jgi:transposase-like protein
LGGSPTKFTETDKARVFVALTSNDGNIKRTTRDTGVAESTVRRWKQEWEKHGPPDTTELAGAVDEFYNEAEVVRLKALRQIDIKIPSATPSALIAIVGVLDDKIARVKGIGQSRKVEHTLVLPSAEEARKLMQGFLEGGLAAAKQRDGEIIDAEVVEQAPLRALPSGPRR